MDSSQAEQRPALTSRDGRSVDTLQRTCETHGAYTASAVDRGPGLATMWTRCPECQAENNAKAAAEAAHRRARFIDCWLMASGTRGRFQRASFENFNATTKDQRDALKACRDFADRVCAGETGTLFLIGPPGTGKTHLACSIVRAVIERTAERAVFTTVVDLVRSIRATWGSRDRENSESSVIAGFVEPLLLVLDDIGANLGSEAEQRHLLDVIDGRYVAERPIVVTSNLTADEIKVSVGERAYDRLRENGRRVVCSWPSHRRTGGQE
jgi:DNA replication protein DnaC